MSGTRILTGALTLALIAPALAQAPSSTPAPAPAEMNRRGSPTGADGVPRNAEDQAYRGGGTATERVIPPGAPRAPIDGRESRAEPAGAPPAR